MDDDVNLPPPGPKQLPPRNGEGGSTPPTGSTATNGYWLHDAAGPSIVVGETSASLSRLDAILAEKNPDVRCRVTGGVLIIEGDVRSEGEVAEIRQLVAELEPGLEVETRLEVKH